MAGIIDVSKNIAQIIGGNQPDATNQPYFYAGSQMNSGAGDGSNIAGINACWAVPPDKLNAEPPYAILMLADFTDGGALDRPEVLVNGAIWKTDFLKCYLSIPRSNTSERDYATLVNLRDTLPKTFAAKLTASSSVNTTEVWPYRGTFAHWEWAAIPLYTVQFIFRVRRFDPVTFGL